MQGQMDHFNQYPQYAGGSLGQGAQQPFYQAGSGSNFQAAYAGGNAQHVNNMY